MNEKSASQDAFYLSTRCPMISTDEIAGLVRTIARSRADGNISLAVLLGESIGYDDERLLAVLELLDRLGLAKSSSGTVELTPIGHAVEYTCGRPKTVEHDRSALNICG